MGQTISNIDDILSKQSVGGLNTKSFELWPRAYDSVSTVSENDIKLCINKAEDNFVTRN